MGRTISKRTLQKGHRIAKAIKRQGRHVRNAYAVGVAQAMKSARRRR